MEDAADKPPAPSRGAEEPMRIWKVWSLPANDPGAKPVAVGLFVATGAADATSQAVECYDPERAAELIFEAYVWNGPMDSEVG